MTARFIVADVFDGLASLEDGSVDLVVTSPPFGIDLDERNEVLARDRVGPLLWGDTALRKEKS